MEGGRVFKKGTDLGGFVNTPKGEVRGYPGARTDLGQTLPQAPSICCKGWPDDNVSKFKYQRVGNHPPEQRELEVVKYLLRKNSKLLELITITENFSLVKMHQH